MYGRRQGVRRNNDIALRHTIRASREIRDTFYCGVASRYEKDSAPLIFSYATRVSYTRGRICMRLRMSRNLRMARSDVQDMKMEICTTYNAKYVRRGSGK